MDKGVKWEREGEGVKEGEIVKKRKLDRILKGVKLDSGDMGSERMDLRSSWKEKVLQSTHTENIRF